MSDHVKNQLYLMCTIPVSFFLTLLVMVPVVKSMWNMLVYPSYHVQLQTGAIVFFVMISPLVKFKVSEEKVLFKDLAVRIASFYLSLLLTWGITYVYTFFI